MKNKLNLNTQIKKLSVIRNILCITAVLLVTALALVAFLKKPFSPVQEPSEESPQKNIAQEAETSIPQINPEDTEDIGASENSETEPSSDIQPFESLPQASEAMPTDIDSVPDASEKMPFRPKDEESVPDAELTAPDADSTEPGAGLTAPDAESTEPGAGLTAPEAESTESDIDGEASEEETLVPEDTNPILPTVPKFPQTTEGTELPAEASTDVQTTDSDNSEGCQDQNNLWLLLFIGLAILLIVNLIALLCVNIKMNQLIRQKKDNAARMDLSAMNRVNAERVQAPVRYSGISVGKIHHIGARERQEDSYGVAGLQNGVLAVVADGMGGLSNGNQISQKIVTTILQCAGRLPEKVSDGVMMKMVQAAADAVHAMIGPENFCKSGSTLLTVLIQRNQMHWAAVGDSHIYFYRNGELIQLNQEHNRGQSLLIQATNGEISMSEAKNATKKGGLTSFVGMGSLKNVERNIFPIPVQPGDRIVLCSDGVFNMLTDEAIIAILKQSPDVQAAADRIQSLILRRNHPQQDNFTAVILGI